jgi:ribosomal protein S18 acetylase RimI-like enzyme
LINITFNLSNQIEIRNHLKSVDDDFIPKLSSYVDLDEYSKKIYEKAERIELRIGKKLIGLIALYANENLAFVTNVSLEKNQQGLGYGGLMMDKLMVYAENNSIKTIKLEVRNENLKAIKFYENRGFKVFQKASKSQTLINEING